MKEQKQLAASQLEQMEEELLDTLDMIHGNADWIEDPLSEEEQAALIAEEQDDTYEDRRKVRLDRMRKRKLRRLIFRVTSSAVFFALSMFAVRSVESAASPESESIAESISEIFGAESTSEEISVEEVSVPEEGHSAEESVNAAEGESVSGETDANAEEIVSGAQYAIPEGTAIPDAATLRSQGVPDNLIDLLNRNPETAGFVIGYLDQDRVQQEPDEIDISAEAAEGRVPLFIQWDRRWGYLTYGDDLFALNGCGPTCLSMVYTGITGNSDWNPAQVGVWAESKNYYVNGAGTAWEMMETGCEELGLSSTVVGMDAGIFRARLNEGKPIIASVYEGDFTDGGHYIVLTDIDEDDMVTVNDPNSPENSSVKWNIHDLLGQMNTAWAYELA